MCNFLRRPFERKRTRSRRRTEVTACHRLSFLTSYSVYLAAKDIHKHRNPRARFSIAESFRSPGSNETSFASAHRTRSELIGSFCIFRTASPCSRDMGRGAARRRASRRRWVHFIRGIKIIRTMYILPGFATRPVAIARWGKKKKNNGEHILFLPRWSNCRESTDGLLQQVANGESDGKKKSERGRLKSRLCRH